MIVRDDKLSSETHQTSKNFFTMKIQVREDLPTCQEIYRTVVSQGFPFWEFYIYVEKLMKGLLLQFWDDFQEPVVLLQKQ